MSQDLDQFAVFKQENEELKKQNEELEEQLRVIKKATEELEKLREGATVEKIANEARNKVYGELGILGILSITGAVGVYFGVYSTATKTIETELRKPENVNEIVERTINESKTEVIESVSKKLVDELKKDKKYQKDITNAVADKILKDEGFIGTFKGIATTTSEIAISKFAQGDPNSALSVASNKALSQKRYFVVAASSTVPDGLRDISLTSKISQEGLKAQICPPKNDNDNKRSALIVVNNNASTTKLSLEDAQSVLSKAKNINPMARATAYILPAEPNSNVYFDSTSCK